MDSESAHLCAPRWPNLISSKEENELAPIIAKVRITLDSSGDWKADLSTQQASGYHWRSHLGKVDRTNVRKALSEEIKNHANMDRVRSLAFQAFLPDDEPSQAGE
jgi:hypothetical protein